MLKDIDVYINLDSSIHSSSLYSNFENLVLTQSKLVQLAHKIKISQQDLHINWVFKEMSIK